MIATLASNAFPATEHDRCLTNAMERARKAFEDRGLGLMPLRQAIFREIAEA
jgi:hypothetical protein